MQRLCVGLGALAGLIAVGMSAYADHALSGVAQANVRSAIQMQGWHALALLFTGLWTRHSRLAHLAALAFMAGIVLFCGGIYAIELRGLKLGPLVPTGGMVLMAGWLLLGLSALRK